MSHVNGTGDMADDDVTKDEYDNDEDWLDVERTEGNSFNCLLCEEAMFCATDWLNHLQTGHQCDFGQLVQRLPLSSFYDYIKVCNYIRREKCTSFEDVMTTNAWKDEVNLVPHNTEDGILTLSFDELCELSHVPQTAAREAPIHVVNSSDLNHPPLQTLPSHLAAALQDDEESVSESSSGEDEDSDSANTKSRHLEVENDDYYFESYAGIGIHKDMLSDKVRTEAYRDFILGNSQNLFKGSTVLDVGCGTGILSMFAAKAGAMKVFAVDNSDILYDAIDIVVENSLEKEIVLLRGRVEELRLPVERVDFIISEWMGYFLLYERMLDSVLLARDRYKPRDIFPRCYSLQLVACDDAELREEHVKSWQDMYGFKMSSMQKHRFVEPHILTCTAESVVSAPVELKHLDLLTCTVSDTEFVAPFRLVASRDAVVTHLCAYFDVDFCPGADKNVTFSTGPQSTSTHWHQTVFWLTECVLLQAGQSLEGSLTVSNVKSSRRSLQILLHLHVPFEKKQEFWLR